MLAKQHTGLNLRERERESERRTKRENKQVPEKGSRQSNKIGETEKQTEIKDGERMIWKEKETQKRETQW